MMNEKIMIKIIVMKKLRVMMIKKYGVGLTDMKVKTLMVMKMVIEQMKMKTESKKKTYNLFQTKS